MNTRFRHSSLLAVIGGLIGSIGAFALLPAYVADAEVVALVIGGLAVYALGAMAVVEYNRARALDLRRPRRLAAPVRSVVVPLPARQPEQERLAA